MDTEKIKAHLAGLSDINASIRNFESCAEVNRAAAAVDTLDQGGLAGLAAELAGDQRFGPLLYSLRAIYSQMADTRAMIDVPRLAEWADTIIARIGRDVMEPAPAAEASASVPSIPEGAKEFIIFESLARPGFRVACYHMGIGNELFGLDEKPRVPPDPTKWKVVAYFDLPAGLDLITAQAMGLPGDEGSLDWYAEKPPATAPAAQASANDGEATALKIEGHAPAIEFRAHCPAPVCGSLEIIGTPVCANCHSKLEWDGNTPRVVVPAGDPAAVVVEPAAGDPRPE